MKYNVTDYNKAKHLLGVLQEDILNRNFNYNIILRTKDNIVSNIVSKRYITFTSSAAHNISAGMSKYINDIMDVDVYSIFEEISKSNFVSLRIYDFKDYNDLIKGYSDPLINSKGSIEFFEKYRNVFENTLVK